MNSTQQTLTTRQAEVLSSLASSYPTPTDTGYDGGVLRGLLAKGLVSRGQNSFPGYIAYYWHITEAGMKAIKG
jgi:hypothetical protein